MNDANAPKDKDQAIREAIREEMDAINTYDLLMELDPEHADTYEEIKNDELDHAKKLLALAERVDPDKHESSEHIGRFASMMKTGPEEEGTEEEDVSDEED